MNYGNHTLLRYWSSPLNKKILDGSFIKSAKIKQMRWVSEPIFCNHSVLSWSSRSGNSLCSSIHCSSFMSKVSMHQAMTTAFSPCGSTLPTLMIDFYNKGSKCPAKPGMKFINYTGLKRICFLHIVLWFQLRIKTRSWICYNPVQTSFLLSFSESLVNDY